MCAVIVMEKECIRPKSSFHRYKWIKRRSEKKCKHTFTHLHGKSTTINKPRDREMNIAIKQLECKKMLVQINTKCFFMIFIKMIDDNLSIRGVFDAGSLQCCAVPPLYARRAGVPRCCTCSCASEEEMYHRNSNTKLVVDLGHIKIEPTKNELMQKFIYVFTLEVSKQSATAKH